MTDEFKTVYRETRRRLDESNLQVEKWKSVNKREGDDHSKDMVSHYFGMSVALEDMLRLYEKVLLGDL